MAHHLARRAKRLLPHCDVVVSGVESITDIGGELVRIVFYINRAGPSGVLERCPLTETLIMPISAVADSIGKAMMAVGRKVICREDGISVAH